MANTYTQIYIQTVFVVKNRSSLIQNEWKEELYKYITGIVQNNNHKMLAINGIPNHIHMFIGMKPHQALSELMQDVKGDSSKWIHQKGFIKGHFEWQPGFGAFSYSDSQIENVVRYVKNQEEHHRKQTFSEEYIGFLNEFKVPYNERFIFRDVKE